MIWDLEYRLPLIFVVKSLIVETGLNRDSKNRVSSNLLSFRNGWNLLDFVCLLGVKSKLGLLKERLKQVLTLYGYYVSVMSVSQVCPALCMENKKEGMKSVESVTVSDSRHGWNLNIRHT